MVAGRLNIREDLDLVATGRVIGHEGGESRALSEIS